MAEPTGSDLRALAGVLDLIDRLELAEQLRTPAWDHSPRQIAWFAFRILVQAIPPDRRLQAIDQVVGFADPDLLQAGPFVTFFERWAGDDANAFLTDLTDLAVDRGRTILAAEPERMADFARHLRTSGAADLVTGRPPVD